MESSPTADTITAKDISGIIGRYSSLGIKNLEDLDRLRYEKIPDLVEERRSDGGAFLFKSEVEMLVQWKMYVQKIHQIMVRCLDQCISSCCP